jgi:4a-hydroxytetrahydrobiopterin dehydratase
VKRPERLGDDVVDGWLARHGSWRREQGHLVRELRTKDYRSSIAIVDAQVELCDRLDHHPILTLGYCELRFELWTHDRGGLTQLDLDYAGGLDELVRAGFSDVLVG